MTRPLFAAASPTQHLTLSPWGDTTIARASEAMCQMNESLVSVQVLFWAPNTMAKGPLVHGAPLILVPSNAGRWASRRW